MDRLISFKSHSRILSKLQASLERVGFALLLWGAVPVLAQEGPDTLWMRLYCPDSTFINYVEYMDVLENDEMIVMGNYLSDTDEVRSYYLSRFDSEGNFLFRSSFGRTMLSGDYCKVSDGFYGVAGSDWDENGINWYAALIGEDGTAHWERTVVMPDDQVLPQVCGTGDGGMLIVSQDMGSVYGYSVGIVMFNLLGDTVFTRRIEYDDPIGIRDVAMMNDGGFAVLVSSGRLLKLDSNGHTEFARSYQFGVSTDFIYIAVLPSGDLVMSGGVREEIGDPIEPLFMRVNPEGDVLWSHVEELPDTVSGYSAGYIVAFPDGGYMFGSPTAEGGALIRFDRNNIEQWRHNYLLENPLRGSATAFALRSNNGFASAGNGQCPNNYSLDAISLFATESDPYLLDSPYREVTRPGEFNIDLCPNPFNTSLRISFILLRATQVNVRVYDAIGRLNKVLLNDKLEMGNHEILWEADAVGSGVYFVQMQTETSCQTAKAVLLK